MVHHEVRRRGGDICGMGRLPRPVHVIRDNARLPNKFVGMKGRGRVQSREQLLRYVWEYNNLIDTRTVDTHMRRLREKLGPASKYLDTVRGVGYRFLEA